MKTTLFSALSSVNGKPSTAGAGVSTREYWKAKEGLVCLHSTAGSGVMDATVRMWGYVTDLAKWFPLGTGDVTLKGTLNAESAAGETDTNSITHCEVVQNLHFFDRIYAELTGINGTATAVTCTLVSKSTVES